MLLKMYSKTTFVKPSRIILIVLMIIPFASYSARAVEMERKTNLTIYSTAVPGSISLDLYRPIPGNQINYPIPGYAMVRDQRELILKEGTNKISFSDVAIYIDPTTVLFKSMTDPEGTSVLEQNYYFDLVSKQKMLERYIGQEITVEQAQGSQLETFTGKLLNVSGDLILQTNEGRFISVNGYSNIRFTDLPGGLITKPTLVWDIFAKKAGRHRVETSYQTSGITWWTDYNAVFTDGKDANNGSLTLSAWVSIINKSGLSYENANLKLIAGNVNRIESRQAGLPRSMMALKMADSNEQIGFTEKAFFEFHLYTLGRVTTIPDNSTKQIVLFPTTIKIPVLKQYYYKGATDVYYGGINTNKEIGAQGNTKVDVYLKFKNDEKFGLGIPLPSGRVRVSKISKPEGSMEFIGEDIIDHTSKNEEVLIKMGNAFDVIGERKQIDFNVDNVRQIMSETFEITIKNHKDEDIELTIVETMNRGVNWKILSNSSQYKKVEASTVHFPLTIKKDSESKIRYTVQYTW
jgi:hypothetical protein